MVGSQDLCLARFIVSVASFVGAADLTAGMAFVALSSILKAEADDVGTAAVITRKRLSNHAKQSTTAT